MRKTIEITITDEGRDKGKIFQITEMPAAQAEEWAMRAFLALSRSGVDIPENLQDAGMAGIAILGLKALGGVNFSDAKILMDEMFRCIKVIIPNPVDGTKITRDLVGQDDIEEVKTRIRLRSEIFTLHTGFSFADAVSKSTSATSASN